MLTGLLVSALLSSAAPTVKAAQPCKPGPEMARTRQPMRARPLAEMPPAKQIYSVYRERNGCAELAVVREEVGAPARR